MAPSKSKDKNKDENIKQEDILQAVVVADSFKNRFGPLTSDRPKGLLPVMNIQLIEYTLQFLSSAGVKQVFLYICKHVDKMKSYIESSRWGDAGCHMLVTVMVLEDAHSFGDVLRNIDARGLLRSDFILLTGDIVSNIELQCIVDKHRQRKTEDKGTLMTLVYRRALPGHCSRSCEDETVLAVDSKTQQILQHDKVYATKKVSLPLEIFQKPCVDLHYDLLDTHISVCSPQVPTLFTDNFDYQTRDDFIRGILENEDILGNTIYLHTCKEGYATPVTNLSMYNSVSRDLLHRWAFPFVPQSRCGRQSYTTSTSNQYKHKSVCIGQYRGSQADADVIIGDGTKIGKNCQIKGSVIGSDCDIGNNVCIHDAYIWNNAHIKDNCKITGSVLSDDVSLEDGCDIAKHCVLGQGVHLPGSTKLNPGEKLVGRGCKKKGRQVNEGTFLFSEAVDSDGDDDVDMSWGLVADPNGISSDSSYSEDEHDSDASLPSSPPPDDLKLFYNEVLDSLCRGLEEKVSCENLILEVNSSKYAYNVTMKELNGQIIRATLDQHCLHNLSSAEYIARLKKMLGHLGPLYKNYYRSVESQVDCLNALEDGCNLQNNLNSSIMKVLHFLYDEEILSEEAIMQWFHADVSDSVKNKVKPFIRWLEEAEEESD